MNQKIVFLCLRPPQNVKLENFTPWSCNDGLGPVYIEVGDPR